MRYLCALLLALTLTACRPATNLPVETPGKINLTWSMWALPTHLVAFKQAKERYEQLHPEVQINFINIPWNQYNNKLVTMAAGNAAPDVMWIDRVWASEMMDRKAFLDLAPFIKNDPTFSLDAFEPGINEYFREGDQLLGLMTHYSVLLLLYNKDLFDQAGVAYPTPEWTWQDFEAAAIKISADTNNDGLLDRFGCYLAPSDYATISSFLWQNGVSPWETTGTLGFNSAPSREALEFILGLAKKKAQPSAAQMQSSDIGEMFKSGRLGMMYTWPSGILEFTRDLPFHYGVAPLPRGKVRATYGGGPAYAIGRTSRQPRAAWEFMKYLLGPEVQLDMARAGLVMPSIKLPREQLLTVFPHPDIIDAYAASLPYSRGMPRLRHQNRVITQFTMNMEDILYEARTIEQGTEEFHRALIKRTKPPIHRKP